MDTRDRHLNRHMCQRFVLAQRLSPERRARWAAKCVDLAARQGRSAFYLMASLWLGDCRRAASKQHP